MATFTWNNGEVKEGLEVTQVYGVIFTTDGRVMLRVEDKPNGKRVYSLAGGTPEDYDADRVATLKRELVEEVNTTIFEPILVGYCEVDEENGKPPYAQVRMTAMINEILEKQPDPATGDTYDRLLTTPEKAIELLKWGDSGKLLIEEAVRIAKENLGLTNFVDFDEYV